VAEEIWRRLPRTLQLMVAATLIAVAIGLPAGAVAALRAGSWLDRGFTAVAGLALGIPVFVAATLMVLVFSQQLRWAPAGGYVGFAEDPVQHLVVLMMPALAASLHLAAAVFLMARSAVLDTLGQDFVRALRAKGLGEWTILFRHVVRNALIPVVTVIGLQMGTMLGGTVLIEYVFNWPGLSGFLLEGVLGRDYPVVVGVVVVVSILFVTINLVVDVLYAVIDPRARHS
jgi:peptide/nickel transport system permease protein